MELCEGGALTDRVNAGDITDEREISRIVASILRFIAQCHAKGLVYRDCKLDNFLFVSHEARSPLKATDFGLSIRHTSGEQPLTSRSGTPAYMAPEARPPSPRPPVYFLLSDVRVLVSRAPLAVHTAPGVHAAPPLLLSSSGVRFSSQGAPRSATRTLSAATPVLQVIMQSYSSKADLWSVGIVTYQLLTGRFPFCDNIRNSSLQDVWKAILSESGRMEKHINKMRGRVSDEACEFVAGLMQRDPSKRFSATQALQHPVRAAAASCTA